MKRIGFVDYRLGGYHAKTYLQLLRNQLKDRGFVVSGCTEMLEPEGQAWATTNGVPYYPSVKELNEVVDYYMVLAPANPEVHLELCEQVLPFGKTTYVDKTFAPDLETARRIFALADEYGVAVQTTSALRYTNVQETLKDIGSEKIRHMVTWGAGRSFEEYAIHPLELVVSCMGSGAERCMRRGTGDFSQLLLDFTAGRTAVVNVYCKTKTPFAASVTTSEETRYLPVEAGEMFLRTAAAVLDLFQSGKPGIDRDESLIIRRVLDVAGQEAALSSFVDL
jgi:predicted dehydrogenase